MNQVYQSAFLKALGWSLIDSLWQMGLMWLIYLALTANGKRYQSHQRHTIALLSLAGGSVWFLISLVINFYEAAAAPVIVNVYEGFAASAVSGSKLSKIAGIIEPALPVLSIGYLVAAAWLFIRFYYRFHQTRQLLKAQMVKAGPELRVFLQTAAARMGIKKKVALWLSAAAEAPMTMGFWKPVILLPLAIVNHLSIQQTEAILLHELQHIKRNDYLINILMAFADVVLFFNPFARWISAAIRNERENSCDDLVLQFRYDPALYASSLLLLEQQRNATAQNLAIAATGSKTPVLLHRVQRILTREQVSTPVSHRMVAYLLTAILFGFIGIYNPGNVIVQKIYPVVFNTAVSLEPVNFTAVAVAEAIPQSAGPARSPRSKKQQPVSISLQLAEPVMEAVPVHPMPVLPSSEPIQYTAPVQTVTISHDDALQIIGLTTGIQIANLVENTLAERERQAAENGYQIVLTAVGDAGEAGINRNFTLADHNQVLCDQGNSAEIKPWVQSNSFAYQPMQDSTAPRIFVENRLKEEAKQAIASAMATLQEVDWSKLEKELNAKHIAISAAQIRQELTHAFMEITWKHITEGSIKTMEDVRQMYASVQADWQKRLENFQRERAKKRAEQDDLRRQIVEERLMENAKPSMKKAIQNKTIEL